MNKTPAPKPFDRHDRLERPGHLLGRVKATTVREVFACEASPNGTNSAWWAAVVGLPVLLPGSSGCVLSDGPEFADELGFLRAARDEPEALNATLARHAPAPGRVRYRREGDPDYAAAVSDLIAVMGALVRVQGARTAPMDRAARAYLLARVWAWGRAMGRADGLPWKGQAPVIPAEIYTPGEIERLGAELRARKVVIEVREPVEAIDAAAAGDLVIAAPGEMSRRAQSKIAAALGRAARRGVRLLACGAPKGPAVEGAGHLDLWGFQRGPTLVRASFAGVVVKVPTTRWYAGAHQAGPCVLLDELVGGRAA